MPEPAVSQNITRQAAAVDRAAQGLLKGHGPLVVWFTGLSGAGKSTVADLVTRRLHGLGRHTMLLDGDNVRHGLSRDLGFSAADRAENIRRVAEAARLGADAGLVVLVALISPLRADRAVARASVGEADFCEVFIDTPLDVAEARDPKGLYKMARAGQLRDFTGLDSPYEAPEAPALRIDTTQLSAAAAAEAIARLVLERTAL